MANVDFIPGTPSGPPNLPRVILECRARSQPEAPPAITPESNNNRTLGQTGLWAWDREVRVHVWMTLRGPCGCDNQGPYSHSWTVKQQCLDLLAEGLWEELLDDEQPDITVMDWWVPRDQAPARSPGPPLLSICTPIPWLQGLPHWPLGTFIFARLHLGCFSLHEVMMQFGGQSS